MKKLLIGVLCVVGLGLAAGSADAANITLAPGDAYYVGWWRPGEPADADNELLNINNLISVDPGDIEAYDPDGAGNMDLTTYNRVGSALGGLEDAEDPAKTDGGATGPFLVNSYSYVLGKYDGPTVGVLVWYLGGLASTDTINLPANWDADGPGGAPAKGLSHRTFFTSIEEDVPDGGATLMLLGGSLVGLAALRRRFSA